MKVNFRLTVITLATMLCLQVSSFAQSESSSKVTIELTYEDEDGKKHSETIEYRGQEAEDFDVDAYEKSLEDRNIKVLNLNINQATSHMKSHGAHEKHDVVVKKKGDKKMKKKIRIMKSGDDIDTDEEMNVEVKDGKVYLNGEVVEDVDIPEGAETKVIVKHMDMKSNGKKGQKQMRIIKSGNDIDIEEDVDVDVEVKDGKVYVNGEMIEDLDIPEGGEHKVIVKTMEIDSKDAEKNIWIAKDGDNKTIDIKKMGGDKMLFISDGENMDIEGLADRHMIMIAEDDDKPRLGIAIEDGKTVNGAEVTMAVPDSPAAKAGLQKGDVVTAINDTKVYGVNSLMSAMDGLKAGEEVKVSYSRDGKIMMTNVKLEKMAGAMKQVIEKEIIIEKKEDKQ